MNDVFVFAGDICDVRADGICTSTNPQLALMIGTGGAVRDRGGWSIQEECARIIQEESRRSGRKFVEPGSVHLTSAGGLPVKGVIHCVASDVFHKTSPAIIQSCIRKALTLADDQGWESLAFPIFGTGHVAFRFEEAAAAIAGEIVTFTPRSLRKAIVTSRDQHQAQRILDALSATFPKLTWWSQG